jgi:carbon monoxide dehydrogenase subunit G
VPTVSFDRQIDVPASPDEAWATLSDVGRLVSWVTVVDQATVISELERYTAVLEDRLGPFRLKADLDIQLTEVRPPAHVLVRASGEDRQVASRISVEVRLRIDEQEGGSRITLDGTYEVSGRVATMGSSTIQKKADRILSEFFAQAERELS